MSTGDFPSPILPKALDASRDETRARQLLRAASQAVDLLLKEGDFDLSIRDSLKIIGDAAGADRSYLFRNHYDETGAGFMSQKFEWNSGIAEPQIDNPELENLPFDAIPDFIEPMLRGGVYSGHIREFPEPSRSILSAQNVKSIIILPIMVDGMFWGYVGFDECKEERLWDADEQAILLSYVSSLGAAVERSNREHELRTATAAAEAANKAKSAFIANVSHEIRTPLNAILGFAELIGDHSKDPTVREYARGIGIAGHNLLSLINDILDLSKIEANRLEIRPRPLSLPGLLAEMQAIFAVKAKEKHLDYEVQIHEGLPTTIIADPTRLRQILFNLIGNAFKYTDSGFIRVGCRYKPCGPNRVDIELFVEDSGIGIPEHQQGQIFEAFRQHTDEKTRTYGGTGLGLTITRRIANLMGGRITLRSEPGSGSTFTVHLPRVPTTDQIALREGWTKKFISFAPSTVLLADDVSSNRAVVRGFLEHSGLRLLEAENGLRAYELADQEKPALILMDMQMPVMDGRTAIHRLRDNPGTASIPVIALTSSALAREDDDIKTLCEGYLRKPISRIELFAELARFLDGSPHDRLHGQTEVFTGRGEDITGAGSSAVASIPMAGNPSQATSHNPVGSGASDQAPEGLRTFEGPADIYCRLFSESWNTAAKLVSIDDVSTFAGDLAVEAARMGDERAMEYAAHLSDACASFDLPRMEALFADFPVLAGYACTDTEG